MSAFCFGVTRQQTTVSQLFAIEINNAVSNGSFKTIAEEGEIR